MVFSEILTNSDYDFAIASNGDDILTYAQLPGDQQGLLSRSGGIDAIVLGGGNDVAQDDGGARIYFGNAGNDSIDGGEGADTIAAGRDTDTVIGGSGEDLLFGNRQSDTLLGGDGSDTLFGGQDADLLQGNAGDDWLSGDRGDDTLISSGGDTLIGGAGEDVFRLTDTQETVIDDYVPQVDVIELPPGLTIDDIDILGSGRGGGPQAAILQVRSTGEQLAILNDFPGEASTAVREEDIISLGAALPSRSPQEQDLGNLGESNLSASGTLLPENSLGGFTPTFFQFEVNQPSTVTISSSVGSLEGVTFSLDLSQDLTGDDIYQQYLDEQVGRSQIDTREDIVGRPDEELETVSAQVENGTYFVGVRGTPGLSYSFEISAEPLSAEDSNNIISPFVSNSTQPIVLGSTSANDSVDVFPFNAWADTGSLDLSLSNITEDVNLALYRDSNFNGELEYDADTLVASSTNPGLASAFISQNVTGTGNGTTIFSDTYFVIVSQADPNGAGTSYEVTFGYEPA